MLSMGSDRLLPSTIARGPHQTHQIPGQEGVTPGALRSPRFPLLPTGQWQPRTFAPPPKGRGGVIDAVADHGERRRLLAQPQGGPLHHLALAVSVTPASIIPRGPKLCGGLPLRAVVGMSPVSMT